MCASWLEAELRVAQAAGEEALRGQQGRRSRARTMPRTSSKFERLICQLASSATAHIDPSSELWTTRSSHLTSAMIATISSTRFPRVAFMLLRQPTTEEGAYSPPSVCPTRIASSSVAKPSSLASGMIWAVSYSIRGQSQARTAMKLVMKTGVRQRQTRAGRRAPAR